MVPLCFEYRSEEYPGQVIFVTILGQFKHHFTGETIYRVREEFERGPAYEAYYTEARMQIALANRIQEEVW